MPEPTRSRPSMPRDYGVPAEEAGMIEWSHATEILAAATMYWVCSVRPDGRPHAVPVWGARAGDELGVSAD